MTENAPEDINYLDGKLLIAMPGMGDARFERSVILMCAHSAEGAMGLIINKPAHDLQFSDLLGQLDIPASDSSIALNVHFGGPVENGRGFVLHSTDYGGDDSTVEIVPAIGMTATTDILKDIASGNGPRLRLLALGYAGWGPGQLESELQGNGWLITDADADLIFGNDDTNKWDAALLAMGVDPRMLSAEGGQA